MDIKAGYQLVSQSSHPLLASSPFSSLTLDLLSMPTKTTDSLTFETLVVSSVSEAFTLWASLSFLECVSRHVLVFNAEPIRSDFSHNALQHYGCHSLEVRATSIFFFTLISFVHQV